MVSERDCRAAMQDFAYLLTLAKNDPLLSMTYSGEKWRSTCLIGGQATQVGRMNESFKRNLCTCTSDSGGGYAFVCDQPDSRLGCYTGNHLGDRCQRTCEYWRGRVQLRRGHRLGPGSSCQQLLGQSVRCRRH